VVLKAAIQVIPTDTMSVFLLPKVLCTNINSMMSRFWWGHKEKDSSIAWISWDKIRRSKYKCGLGYRDIECFNLALLAKQGSRFLQNTDSSVAKVFKEEYFPNAGFLNSILGYKPLYAWRSLWNAKPLLKQGLLWRVGDGHSIKVWKDCWIPSPTSYSVWNSIHVIGEDATVNCLIYVNTNWWNTSFIHEIFNEDKAKLICGMTICPYSQRDQLVWLGTNNDLFTVISACHLAKEISVMSKGMCSSVYGTKFGVFNVHMW
jgi:hypothetical protein